MKIEQLTGMAKHGSVNFAAAYTYLDACSWQLEVKKLAIAKKLTGEEIIKLEEIRRKRIYGTRVTPTKFERRCTALRAGMSFISLVSKRKNIRRIRKEISLLTLWNQFRNNEVDTNSIKELIKPDGYWKQKIGKFASEHEKYHIWKNFQAKEEKPLHLKLPLYACSGELEADEMDGGRIYRIAHTLGKGDETSNHRVTTLWKHSEKLEFKRDGGGQAETTFQIRPELARVACGLVRKIGKPSRNGGHIHINCQKDEAIGRRVYAALRFNLSWMRWLAGAARRHHSWSTVDNVVDTFEHATIKGSALTRHTWNRTGTVEMRIWPTSAKSEDWLGRASLMQAIAKWSESYSPIVHPINQETEALAWPLFFNWASINAPEALVYTLDQFRKRARSTSIHYTDREAAGRLMGMFEESGVTVRGYRRRNRVGVPTPVAGAVSPSYPDTL